VYQPSSFQETRIDVLYGLMRTHALATLVTSRAGEFAADHIPVQTLPSPSLYPCKRQSGEVVPAWDYAADRRGVVGGLRAAADPQSHQIADLLDGWRVPEVRAGE
jgi:predicted FMN-binding regulatory protein PaiB